MHVDDLADAALFLMQGYSGEDIVNVGVGDDVTIRELADELDPSRFVQTHRSVIVNLHEVLQVTRGANETAEVQLKGRRELLPVSRSYLHLFRQM